MGVLLLETFIKNEVPGGTLRVSIKKECERFQSETGMRPTLVFDVMGVTALLRQNKMWALCGGRQQLYRKRLEDLFENLSSFADLVFFEDGPPVDEKLRTKVYRHSARNIMEAEIVKQFDEGKPWKDIKGVPRINAFKSLVQNFGEVIIAVTKECDTELARYANNNPSVLAVVADDTDFLIFAGSWRYFSLQHIDFEHLTTTEYSRSALRNFLDLNDKGMKILSTLGGNDIVRREELYRFHQEIRCGRTDVKFPRLANYIKQRLPMDFDALINTIARNVLNDERQETKDRIKDSLEQYNTNFDVKDYSDSNPLLRLCIEKKLKFCFKVLKNLALKRKIKDIRHFEYLPNFNDTTEVLMRMQLGVLLQHNRMNGKHDLEPDEIYEPIYPELEVPPLLQFLNRDKHPEHDEMRFKLLKWMISEEMLESYDLSRIPENYLLHLLALVFMTIHGFITIPEADVILFTIRQVELGLVPVALEPPAVLHSRAYCISIQLNMLSKNILASLSVTGLLNSSMIISNFDGVFFHIKYLDFVNSEFNPTDQLTDIEPYRLYK